MFHIFFNDTNGTKPKFKHHRCQFLQYTNICIIDQHI